MRWIDAITSGPYWARARVLPFRHCVFDGSSEDPLLHSITGDAFRQPNVMVTAPLMHHTDAPNVDPIPLLHCEGVRARLLPGLPLRCVALPISVSIRCAGPAKHALRPVLLRRAARTVRVVSQGNLRFLRFSAALAASVYFLWFSHPFGFAARYALFSSVWRRVVSRLRVAQPARRRHQAMMETVFFAAAARRTTASSCLALISHITRPWLIVHTILSRFLPAACSSTLSKTKGAPEHAFVAPRHRVCWICRAAAFFWNSLCPHPRRLVRPGYFPRRGAQVKMEMNDGSK